MQDINTSFDKVLKLSSKKLAINQEKKEMADILSDLSEEDKAELAKKVNQRYIETENPEEKTNLSGMGLYIKGFTPTPEEKEQKKQVILTKNVELLRTGVCKIVYTTNKREFQIVIYQEDGGYKVRINEKIENERKKIRDKDQPLPYRKNAVIKNDFQELLIGVGKILDLHAGTNRKKIPEEVKKAYELLQKSQTKKIEINRNITPNIRYQKEYLE